MTRLYLMRKQKNLEFQQTLVDLAVGVFQITNTLEEKKPPKCHRNRAPTETKKQNKCVNPFEAICLAQKPKMDKILISINREKNTHSETNKNELKWNDVKRSICFFNPLISNQLKIHLLCALITRRTLCTRRTHTICDDIAHFQHAKRDGKMLIDVWTHNGHVIYIYIYNEFFFHPVTMCFT